MASNHGWGSWRTGAIVVAVTGIVCGMGACSSDGAPPADEVESSVAAPLREVAESAQAREALADVRRRFVVRSIAPRAVDDDVEHEVELPALGPSVADGFSEDGLSLIPRLRPDARADVKRPARVGLPLRSAEPTRLQDETSGASVEVQLEDAHDVEAEVADGFVIYRGALGARVAGGDVIARVREDGVEDYVVIEGPPSRPELRLRLLLGQGAAGLRLVENVLEVVDADNGPVLRMARPYLVDATGRQRDAFVDVEGCAADRNPVDPWERELTPPGARACRVVVTWGKDVEYPALLDPAWTTTGSMAVSRAYHAASRVLTSGGAERVLVTGGQSGTTYRDTAELYNPSLGTFASAGSMSQARAFHTSTLLTTVNNGPVLICGGQSSALSSGVTSTCERYTPSSGWGTAPSMTVARSQHTAVMIRTTDASTAVLVSGGRSGADAATALASQAVYLAATNSWATVSNLGTARFDHSAVRIAPGIGSPPDTVLLAGGRNVSDVALASAQRFTCSVSSGSQSCSSTSTAPMNQPRSSFPLVLLKVSNQAVAVSTSGTAHTDVYANSTNTWTVQPAGPQIYASGVAAPMNGDSGSGGRVLVTGHEGLSRTAGVFDWASLPGTWYVASAPGVVGTSHGRGTATYLLTANLVLAAGGAATLSGTQQVPNSTAVARLFQQMPNGEACGAPGDCTSRFCVDGVCCNAACAGTCMACSQAKKGQGSDGVCGNIATGIPADPGECTNTTACMHTGNCNGSGACQLQPNGTNCGASTCSGGTQTNSSCNGMGTCNQSQVACSPYACNVTTCRTSCSTDSHCVSTHYCSGSTCTPKKANGLSCTGANQCTSGFCADGVCCNEACTAGCKACTAAKKGPGGGADGECGNTANGTDPDSDCTSSAQTTCGQDGQCNGQGACRLWASGTTCGANVCDGNTSKERLCNGTGSCTTAPTGQICDPQVCSGGVCGSCANDAGCTSSHYCSGGACLPKKAQGLTCSGNNQCTSGFCVDGVCCNNACTAACQACSAAKKGAGGGADGECGFVVSGNDPDGDCVEELPATCGNDGTCNGSGGCRKWASGTSCGSGNVCVGNLVTGQICNGSGSCNPEPTGVECSPQFCVGGACAPCLSDAGCASGHYCDSGTCKPKLGLGQSCSSSNQCTAGNCVDGFCCNAPCGSLCQACSAAKKGAGVNGECGPIAVGTDPDNECSTGAECQQNGFCNGAGACQLQVAGTPCSGTVCISGNVHGRECNGSGACVTGSQAQACSPYVCSGGVCASPCTTSSNCLSGHFCQSGTCHPKQANGQGCADGSHCTSGFCVDGVCCATACSGLCQACSVAKKGGGVSGECGPIAGGTDPDDECATGAECQQNGLCSGTGTCQLQAAGTPCSGTVCVAGSVHGRECSGLGSCVTGSPIQACSPFLCSGGACTSPCSTTADCASGHWCDTGACVAKSANGAQCGSAAECASGNCVDGVCCSAACSGLCQACTAQLKGQGVDGECGPIKSGTDPDNECQEQAGCGQDGFCSGGGSCSLKAAGTSCGTGTQCKDATTVVGQVCNGTGLCEQDPTAETNCAPHLCSGGACQTPCSTDQHCVAGFFCGFGTCTAKQTDGAACASGGQCLSGFCSDGVCCNSACTSTCMACKASLKEAGIDGECGAAKNGLDPHNDCPDEGALSCQRDGQCDGKGACRLYTAGVACGAATCDGNIAKGQICNGQGACGSNPSGVTCAPYLCQAGSCTTSCQNDAGCLPNAFCGQGLCAPKLAAGAACTVATECVSANCVDGVCCASACNGQCEACDVPGSEGQCVTVTGPPHGTRQPCAGAGACQGQCDGTSPTECVLPGNATECAPASCAGDVSQPVGGCDGTGSCSVPPTANCLPYGCDATTGACRTSCVTASDCAQGAQCDPSTGKCAVAGATCKDSFTVQMPGGQEQSCAPYRCIGGACQDACAATGDCAPGYECNAPTCVPAADAGAGGSGADGGMAGSPASPGVAVDDGGCGCRTPRSGRGGSAWWMLVALGVSGLGWRRRKRPATRDH